MSTMDTISFVLHGKDKSGKGKDKDGQIPGFVCDLAPKNPHCDGGVVVVPPIVTPDVPAVPIGDSVTSMLIGIALLGYVIRKKVF